jgi:hypothetical protein
MLASLPEEDVVAFASAISHKFQTNPILQRHAHDHCGCGHDHDHEHDHHHHHDEPDIVDQVRKVLRESIPVSAESPEEMQRSAAATAWRGWT